MNEQGCNGWCAAKTVVATQLHVTFFSCQFTGEGRVGAGVSLMEVAAGAFFETDGVAVGCMIGWSFKWEVSARDPIEPLERWEYWWTGGIQQSVFGLLVVGEAWL
jgi:hypothetical protein